MKKIFILFFFYSNFVFSQTIDWKAIFLSKEKWYVKEMLFDKDTFMVASESNLSFEMPENQIVDEYGLQIFSSDEYLFSEKVLRIKKKLDCGKTLSMLNVDYEFSSNYLYLYGYSEHNPTNEADYIYYAEFPFHLQLMKYEKGLVFMKKIEIK